MESHQDSESQTPSFSSSVGLLLFIAGMLCAVWIAWVSLDLGFWTASPREKFLKTWAEDIRLLQASGTLPPAWSQIKDINIRTDNSPIHEWLEKAELPIKKNPKGNLLLEVFAVHWIEGHRYGVVLQYKLLDGQTKNTIAELGRTFKLGIVY
jgi:hypothetical protein